MTGVSTYGAAVSAYGVYVSAYALGHRRTYRPLHRLMIDHGWGVIHHALSPQNHRCRPTAFLDEGTSACPELPQSSPDQPEFSGPSTIHHGNGNAPSRTQPSPYRSRPLEFWRHSAVDLSGVVAAGGIIWSVFGAFITVTAPDGRQKKTQVGGHRGNPQGLARIMAGELANEQLKPA